MAVGGAESQVRESGASPTVVNVVDSTGISAYFLYLDHFRDLRPLNFDQHFVVLRCGYSYLLQDVDFRSTGFFDLKSEPA
jgi:hypothetical protein